MQPLITFNNVTFQYRDTPILEDVSFAINRGEYVGVLGPNGGGKTTMLKLLLGLLKPTRGSIQVLGKPAGSAEALRRIGYVPQWASKEDWRFPATVEEILCTGVSIHADRLTAQRTIDDALSTVRMTAFKHRLINELSGGQRQRVFIARALAARPEILILDEPTVGVDIATQELFYSLLRQLNAESQMTILLVSHDIDVITQEVNTVLCLNRVMVCHVSSKDFIEKEEFAKLYGEKGKYILHRH